MKGQELHLAIKIIESDISTKLKEKLLAHLLLPITTSVDNDPLPRQPMDIIRASAKPFKIIIHKGKGGFNPKITVSSGCGGSEPCGRETCTTYHGKKKNYGAKPVIMSAKGGSTGCTPECQDGNHRHANGSGGGSGFAGKGGAGGYRAYSSYVMKGDIFIHKKNKKKLHIEEVSSNGIIKAAYVKDGIFDGIIVMTLEDLRSDFERYC